MLIFEPSVAYLIIYQDFCCVIQCSILIFKGMAKLADTRRDVLYITTLYLVLSHGPDFFPKASPGVFLVKRNCINLNVIEELPSLH